MFDVLTYSRFKKLRKRGDLLLSADNIYVAMQDSFMSMDQLASQAGQQANAWVARFAPLVLTTDGLTEKDVRNRILLVDQLKQEAPQIADRLKQASTYVDPTLVSTFTTANTQLNSIDSDLRSALAKFAPGDPQSAPDLQMINDKLAERQAREELGVPNDPIPAKLDLETSPANWAGAGMIGIFGIGWTSFTTLHMCLMIGGMMKSIGIAALALIGFYAIFYAAGFAMLASAVAAASTETIELDGHQLTIRRKLGGWVRTKQFQLAPLMPTIEDNPTSMHQRGQPPTKCIVLTDVNSKPVRIASGATDALRLNLEGQIERYLRAQPSQS